MDRIGRYRIDGELGRGAMGVVYHAIDPAIGRALAIKTIRIRDIDDAQQRSRLRERLFREARSAGMLSHPNIVTIYDVDETDGIAYIAMAFVNGPSLDKVMARPKPMAGAEMLRILKQAAQALDFAHSKGIIHRDVKPANIMTGDDGVVKIADFGIAKITAPGNATETRTVTGTPAYMSPEQVQGLAIDGRSDQFSLAVIAYEILTGERPFVGDQLSTIVYRIVNEAPVPPHRLNSSLSPRISDVLMKALSKKPEDRFPNCAIFVGALEFACAEAKGWKTQPVGAAPALTTVVEPRPVPKAPGAVPARVAAVETVTPVRPRPKKRSFVPVFLTVLILLGLAGAAVYQAGGGQFDPKQIVAMGEQVMAMVRPAPTNTTSPPPPEPAPAAPTTPALDPAASVMQDQKPAETAPPPVVSETAPAPTQPEYRKPSPVEQPVARGKGVQQDIWVTTKPAGARAVIDGDMAGACDTPCMLRGAQGVRHLAVVKNGYQAEYRDVTVGETAVDVPLITLREPTGTLMLASEPAGANIRINGQLIRQVTPVQLLLAPGSYSITLEKDGKKQTETVEVKDGPAYLHIPLDR